MYLCVDKCARAPRSLPPTPILFFSGNRENLEVILAKTQFQSLNPAAANPWGSVFWLRSATHLHPTPSFRSRQEIGEQNPGSGEARGKSERADPQKGAQVCNEDCVSAGYAPTLPLPFQVELVNSSRPG